MAPKRSARETLHEGIRSEEMRICARICGQISQSSPLRKFVLARFAGGDGEVGPGGQVGAVGTQRKQVEGQAALGIHGACDVSCASVPTPM
jgi:hypothetical protein